ncbi:hypothetical protein DFA_00296 [Cavenderia fasciculata]|uniref:Uncharacterized protein n=1 Tax=Cavenderia fasciculata TaxID=261658 RepID=F4PY58_CACFS|nr:uncharacterized protein DFA_00296 [Cavenderia fasciculata]EGG19718.1 hypothetical protein DFA_00296 [Cavenderia fasciculata]|eukprot:XP_004358012.1 hypothetical protein DFA_00296 [Cavenderia fasciculata]
MMRFLLFYVTFLDIYKPTNMLKVKESVDPNEAVVENIDFQHGRVLRNHDIISRVFNETLKKKLSITTLKDVLHQFNQTVDKSSLNFNFKTYDRQSVIFQYEDKFWKGTITKEISIYKQKKTKFINIKLPNDGYVYSSKYLDDQKQNDSFIVNEETSSFITDLESLVPFEGGWVEINYKEEDSRFEIYFTDDNQESPSILTIKFEYGYYENWVNGHKYTRSELKKLLNK